MMSAGLEESPPPSSSSSHVSPLVAAYHSLLQAREHYKGEKAEELRESKTGGEQEEEEETGRDQEELWNAERRRLIAEELVVGNATHRFLNTVSPPGSPSVLPVRAETSPSRISNEVFFSPIPSFASRASMNSCTSSKPSSPSNLSCIPLLPSLASDEAEDPEPRNPPADFLGGDWQPSYATTTPAPSFFFSNSDVVVEDGTSPHLSSFVCPHVLPCSSSSSLQPSLPVARPLCFFSRGLVRRSLCSFDLVKRKKEDQLRQLDHPTCALLLHDASSRQDPSSRESDKQTNALTLFAKATDIFECIHRDWRNMDVLEINKFSPLVTSYPNFDNKDYICYTTKTGGLWFSPNPKYSTKTPLESSSPRLSLPSSVPSYVSPACSFDGIGVFPTSPCDWPYILPPQLTGCPDLLSSSHSPLPPLPPHLLDALISLMPTTTPSVQCVDLYIQLLNQLQRVNESSELGPLPLVYCLETKLLEEGRDGGVALKLEHKMNLGTELRESVKRLRWQRSDDTGRLLIPMIATNIPIGFVVVITVQPAAAATPKSCGDRAVSVSWTMLELCCFMRHGEEESGGWMGPEENRLKKKKDSVVRTADKRIYADQVNGLQKHLATLFEDIGNILHQNWLYAPTGCTEIDAPVEMTDFMDWQDGPILLLYLLESFYTGTRLAVNPSCLYCLRFALAKSLLLLSLLPAPCQSPDEGLHRLKAP
eukprot:GHVS01020738.1.p1 GENE.GHVS01020738.1~~GHVS01020738.1.p1  ORF type:complete len:706 (-),score=147.31 GHVS01020738.1:241-2358(-)